MGNFDTTNLSILAAVFCGFVGAGYAMARGYVAHTENYVGRLAAHSRQMIFGKNLPSSDLRQEKPLPLVALPLVAQEEERATDLGAA